ncbi:MAG: mechanosensitive ion channel [Candidatus Abyssubacteria bacterium]
MTYDAIVEWGHKIFDFTIVTINRTPVTVASLIVFLFIFIGVVLVAKVVSRMLRVRVLSRVGIDEGMRYTLERLTYYTLIIIGAIVAFQFIGINLSGLAVIFGLLSVGIGFGLQNITSNFISGLILLFERPIKVGDRITVGDTEGDVMDINMRSTTIRSLNNISIIVPNSEFISGRVTNWSYGDPKVRLDIDVGVSYASDLDTVLRCLKEVALENERILRYPEPVVQFLGFGDSSWNMQLRCWIADPKIHWEMRSELNCAIVRKFRRNKVEIPFPQRDLHLRSAIPLPVVEQEAV